MLPLVSTYATNLTPEDYDTEAHQGQGPAFNLAAVFRHALLAVEADPR